LYVFERITIILIVQNAWIPSCFEAYRFTDSSRKILKLIDYKIPLRPFFYKYRAT